MDRRLATDLLNLGGLFKEIEHINCDISNDNLYRFITDIMYKTGDFKIMEIENKINDQSSYFLLLKKLNDATEKYPDDLVNLDLFRKLKVEIKQINECLINYLSSITIAFPESKKIDVKFLLMEPWRLFNDHRILNAISESIKEDLILFCQCYAYGIYTSAIIHILKATENYNIYFYEKISNLKTPSTMTWGKLINNTAKKLDELNPNNIGFKKLKDSLEDLKRNNRVKIIHMNKVIYDEEEAFKIFEDCRIVMSKMFYILDARGMIDKQSFNLI
ncbi:hypothetical protein [Winogradskyella sp.]|uniref:hypothetical protein n=1 Tax=Winogradskyella sp. TaxID=1883156 RepID=UPI003AB2EFDF